MLYSRLLGIREDKSKVEALQAFDEFSLLGESKTIESIDDIFSDDDVGILSEAETSIFSLKNVPVIKTDASSPNYVARRKPCLDFASFEPLFKQCQADLATGKRKIHAFTQAQEAQIHVGDFFVLKGILVYVAEEGDRQTTSDGKYNARLRCIFENGTESDMLLRSLAAELYQDGRSVSKHEDQLIRNVTGITEEDKETGYVYVLKSLSGEEKIKSLKHLYKIGFSRIAVEDRIKTAEEEPTFLMSPVEIISVYQCFNLNPQKMELLLHRFFGSACLNIDIFDGKGNRYSPREWFIAPLPVIEQAIAFLISGEIIQYRYDTEHQTIMER
jgi:hypothetical protein